MARILEHYDVAVVGAGHAGCEAALACARLGLETVLFTVSVESIAMMPCNPNIGGSSKGHLVREVDALGGEMGKNIDRTFIQSRMLNVSKGPAVHSLRAQADKAEYSRSMRRVIENQEHLTVRQTEVSELLTDKDPLPEEEFFENRYDGDERDETISFVDKSMQSLELPTKNGDTNTKTVDNCPKIIGVRTVSGALYLAKAVVLCTGVYLKARCIYGDVSTYTGPNGLMAANHLSQSLADHGIRLVRFKTGTPARIDRRSIDFSKMEEQPGDKRVVPFSFSTDPESVQIPQESCWLTYTNEETHRVIRDNIDRSPLYSGVIHATGPRDVQVRMYRSVPGLEHARIVRCAYAIEYDCLAPKQLKNTLEFHQIRGLFSGGQFNGSSGYEEAAAQGLIAGINAVCYIRKEEPLVLLRSEAYIGVLIDDLVTRENREPYRMMTSRAEYRLLLRQDNADLRLRRYGHRVGLISDAEMEALGEKERQIREEIARVKRLNIGTGPEVQTLLMSLSSTPLPSGSTMAELIRRPELTYDLLAPIDPERPELPAAVREQVNIEIKYEGYIERQKKQVEQFAKMEKKPIPDGIDYDQVASLRLEARQKLKEFRPSNIGQASRISGVTPADVSVLLVYLKKQRG